jgi:hypothetical protein
MVARAALLNNADRVSRAAWILLGSGGLGVSEARQVGCVFMSAVMEVRRAVMHPMASSIGDRPGRVYEAGGARTIGQ